MAEEEFRPSTPSFHTMRSPARVGGCVTAFLQLFEWNPSKRFSLASKRPVLAPDLESFSDKFSRRSRKLEDRRPAAPSASQFLAAGEEGNSSIGFPPPENFSTPSDFRNPMVLGKKRVPGVVARLMGLESLPAIASMSHPRTCAELLETESSADNRSAISCFDEVTLEYEQSESPPAMLQELLLCGFDEADTGGTKLNTVGLVQEGLDAAGKIQDAGKKSQLWKQQQQQQQQQEESLAPQADSHGVSWEEDMNIVQDDLLLLEKKDKSNQSILPPNRSSTSLLCHRLGPGSSLPGSKSHNQMSSLLLRSPSTKKGTAGGAAGCPLDQSATVKLLEPNMQPSGVIRSQPSHDRQPTPPSTPSLHDLHRRNGTFSQAQKVVVTSETARKVRSRVYSSSSSSSNNNFPNLQSGSSKELRGRSRSRTWNGLSDDSEVISSSAQVDSSSLNRGSVSFRESPRYEFEGVQNAYSSIAAPGNHHAHSLSPPGNNVILQSKAVDLKMCNSLETTGSTILKMDEAASMEKLKSKLINALGTWSAMASDDTQLMKASSSATDPDFNQKTHETNMRQHQARRSLSFSFGDPESIVTEFLDFKEVPEPLSPQLPVPSVPAISQNQLLSGSPVSGSNGDYETFKPAFVSPVLKAVLAAANSCDLPSSPASTSKKWRSHEEEVCSRNPQQPSPTTSLLQVPPVAAIEAALSPTLVPGNGKPVPPSPLPIVGEGAQISVLNHVPMVVEPDKDAIFPKQHRLLPPMRKVQKVDLLHGGGGGLRAHQVVVPASLSLEEVSLVEEEEAGGEEEDAFSSKPVGMMTMASNRKKLVSVRRNGNSSSIRAAAGGKQAEVVPKGVETTVRSVLLHPQSVPHTKCTAKAIVGTSVNPKTLRTKKSSTPEIQHSNQIVPLTGTRDQRAAVAAATTGARPTSGAAAAAATAAIQTTRPVELNRGFFAERVVDSRNAGKENKRFIEGRCSPSHTRARSVDDVFPELPLDSDLTASNSKIAEKIRLRSMFAHDCQDHEVLDHRSSEHKKRSIMMMASPLGDRRTTLVRPVCDESASDDGTRIGTFPDPYNSSTPLFSKCFGDLHSEDEIKHWRRSLLLMGLISESQACNNVTDSTHDLSVLRDTLWVETSGAWSVTIAAAAAEDSADGGSPETPEHAVSLATPLGTCEEEEEEEGLTPILKKWFLERSNSSAMGIEQGEQPSPVSILDSPFHDEVSTTPEASLAESEQQLDEVLELQNTCAGGVIRCLSLLPSEKVDVEKVSNAPPHEEQTCSGGNFVVVETAGISSSREKEKIRQAIIDISKFQNAKLIHGSSRRLLRRPPAAVGPEEEQSFIHGILKASKILSESVEKNKRPKWFAPGLPMDPSLFDRLESGDSEQINLPNTGAKLAQTKISSCLHGGVLWRCDRKLLFDSMNEALVAAEGEDKEECCDEELQKKPWVNNNDDDIMKVGISDATLAPSCRCKLVDRVYGTIRKWRELASSDIDSLIDRDMNCGIGKWRYYEQEIADFSLEIGSLLLGMMIEELVNDVAAAASSQLLESAPKEHPRISLCKS